MCTAKSIGHRCPNVASEFQAKRSMQTIENEVQQNKPYLSNMKTEVFREVNNIFHVTKSS